MLILSMPPASIEVRVPIRFSGSTKTEETNPNPSEVGSGACSSDALSCRRQAQATSDDCNTLATMKSSDGGSACAWPQSHYSIASSCTCSTAIRTCVVHGTSGVEVRKRYLRRLGILEADDYNNDKACDANASASGCSDVAGGSASRRQERIGSWISEGACSPRRSILKPAHSSLTQSSSHGALPIAGLLTGNRREKIILLRRSVQYTTKLKADPTEDEDGSNNTLLAKKPNSGGDAADASTIELKPSPPSSNSKFELSSAWSSLLSKDSASSSTASTSATTSSEPLDGAYDLFSLPSDSSIATASTTRCDSNRSLDTTLERPPSRDDFSSCASSSSRAPTTRRRRKVSFDSTVKAATIPSRTSYSTRTSTRLWSSSEDIHANAVRNEREYVFDGKDWRTAREEDDFLRCPSSSSIVAASSSAGEELVHPVHLFPWRSSRPRWHQERPRVQVGSTSYYSARTDKVGEEQANTEDDYSSGMFEME